MKPLKVARCYIDNSPRTCIVVREGHKFNTVVVMDSAGLKLKRVKSTEDLPEVEYHGKPYPLARAVRHFKGAAKRFGITKGAKQALHMR